MKIAPVAFFLCHLLWISNNFLAKKTEKKHWLYMRKIFFCPLITLTVTYGNYFNQCWALLNYIWCCFVLQLLNINELRNFNGMDSGIWTLNLIFISIVAAENFLNSVCVLLLSICEGYSLIIFWTTLVISWRGSQARIW